ncbi:MAG: winged helix-turn-helix transcriptional regulator [Anaerolineaceae bacterium]
MNIKTAMEISSDHNSDLVILEQIEKDPDATQANLAAQLGVAVATINWHLKRLIAKGYVKARRVGRRKLRYIITPEGLALRAHLTLDYIQTSFHLFRLIRQRMQDAIAQVRQAGFERICLEGDGDIADVCRLTCLENGIAIVQDDEAPRVIIRAMKLFVVFEKDNEPSSYASMEGQH